MPAAYRAILSLLVTNLFMVVGNGLLNTLTPFRAKLEAMSATEIGLISSGYFLGMLIGALISPWLIGRSGHIRAFCASIALCAIAALAMPVFVSSLAWLLARALMGMMFAVMYSTLESWLQGKSPDSMRGQILAVYSMIQYAGMAIGNVLFGMAEPQSHVLFSMAAVAMCLAILPLSLSQQATPAGPTSHSLRLGWLYRSSPVGFVVSLFVGLGSGPFWSLTPVYGATIGLTAVQVATLMTAITLGSALCQYPAGRLSDLVDRRIVLVGLFGVAIAVSAAVWLFGATMGFALLLVAMFLLGGAMTAPYYVAAAHANDRVEAKDTVTIASALLFLYCAGAIVGPMTATAVVAWLGPGGLYAHNLVCQCVVVLFILARMRSRPRPVARDYPASPKPL